jgi:hypothetical protein
MMTSQRLALSLFSMSILGCEPALDACESAAQHEASAQLGVGERNFQSLVDGDTVDFYSGMQGGQHVFGAVQTTGLVTGQSLILGGVRNGVELNFTVLVDDIEFGWGGRSSVALDGGEDDAELVGEYIFVEFWDLFDALDDDEIEAYADYDYYQDALEATIEVDLIDSCGTQVSDSHQVLLQAYGS